MRNFTIVVSTVLVGMLVFGFLSAQSPTRTLQTPTPVLVSQPDSPLEVVSMRSKVVSYPAGTPQRVVEGIASYAMEVRNRTNVPIMAFAIRHETPAGDGTVKKICQGSQGLSKAMVGSGETKTIQSNLHKHGAQTTPVVDMVLLADGTFYGKDSCGILKEYQTRIDERRTSQQLIVQRLQKDGPDKTLAWLKGELAKDVQPVMRPRSIK